MEYEATRDEARRLLAEGDASGAYEALRSLLEGSLELAETPRAAELLSLLADVAHGLGAGPVIEVLVRASKQPDAPRALYDAAYAMYEQKQHRVAAAMLGRADRREPGDARILAELSSNLEAIGANEEAALRLRLSGAADRDAVCRYLLAFNDVMHGELDEPRRLLPALGASTDGQVRGMAGEVEAMLARADALRAVTPLDRTDLSGWHLVVNGSLLLHESPHGFDEGMHGRYAYVCDAFGLLREGIERTRIALAAARREPGRVVAAPDRSSRIVARAAAELLGLPLVPWEEGKDGPGLVVVHDLDHVGDADVLEHLRHHRPGQRLFAHASCWTDPFPYAPDVTTFLYQTAENPWSGGAMQVDQEKQQVVRAPPDEAPEEEIAARIVSAMITDASHRSADAVIALARAVRDLPPAHAAGLFRNEGHRRRQRVGSPVPSNRFP
jgi:hypothetical protein